MSKKITALIPGAALALGIACIAKWLETLERSAGLHLIGASVIALFIGMAINAFFQPNKTTAPGIKFTSKKVLKFAIVLLGASLNIRTVLTVGRFSLTVMLFTLATCFGLGALIGKALGLNWKTSSLINAGTGICGGSAIAAIAPVIEADDMDIAYGMSATFLFDTVMIVVFPLLGRWLGLSDAAFGLWAGTAVNDTSSVVATGYAFSEAAGDFATMVKLTRTLAIIPAVLVFAAINLHLKKKESAQANGVKVSIRSIFPWFILAFLAMSLLTSLGLLPAGLVSGLKTISKFLMVAALAAIGLNTNSKSLCRSGAKPMLHGFIISTLVVLVAIAQPAIGTIVVAIGLVTWPTVARLVRAEFRSLREKDFVLAARALGYSHARIILREILPNALPPIIVTSSVMVASAILLESALSFMGMGDPNVISWGSMIGAGRELLRTAWYLTAAPGLAIVFAVLAFNLIGDGLNDALNPRFSQER
mgnify:CR=1 FL=1